jgi:hypothetical protein
VPLSAPSQRHTSALIGVTTTNPGSATRGPDSHLGAESHGYRRAYDTGNAKGPLQRVLKMIPRPRCANSSDMRQYLRVHVETLSVHGPKYSRITSKSSVATSRTLRSFWYMVVCRGGFLNLSSPLGRRCPAAPPVLSELSSIEGPFFGRLCCAGVAALVICADRLGRRNLRRDIPVEHHRQSLVAGPRSGRPRCASRCGKRLPHRPI